jgi:hypothetical protein
VEISFQQGKRSKIMRSCAHLLNASGESLNLSKLSQSGEYWRVTEAGGIKLSTYTRENLTVLLEALWEKRLRPYHIVFAGDSITLCRAHALIRMLSGFNMLSPTPYRCFLPLMTPFSLLDRSKDHQILLIEYSNDRCLGKPEEMEGMLRNGTPDIFVFGTNLHHSKVRQVLESKGLRSEVCGVQVLPPPRDVEFVYESADEYPFYLDSLDYYCSRLTQIADPKSTKLMFNLQHRVESSEYQDFDVLNERAQVLLGTS